MYKDKAHCIRAMTSLDIPKNYPLQIQTIRDTPGSYLVSLSDLPAGEYTLVFLIDGAEYPFEQHCRYVRHRDASMPYTFPNMDFGETPPGVRVGPWPGWRGIPTFPGVGLLLGTKAYPVALHVWGDELTQRHIRGVVELTLHGEREIILDVGDPRLVPTEATAYPTTLLRISPLPVALLPEFNNVHPRLLCSSAILSQWVSRSRGTHRQQWGRLVDLLNNWPLPFAVTPESKTVAGPERLSAEDRVLISALISFVDPTTENTSRARGAFLSFITLTQQPGYEPLTIDTQSGETLFVLCIGYDWLYHSLTAQERADAQRWLYIAADTCWAHLGYDRHDFAQAHYLGCGLGLLAFSLLFWEDHARAREWTSHLAGVLQKVRSLLPEDGFYPHGINLWIYEYGFLLRWLELLRHCTDRDGWGSPEHWVNSSRFRAAATSPDAMYGVTFGDPQFRVGGDSWCHYLIARRTGSSSAQRLGNILSEVTHEGVDYRSMCPRRRVYEFIFYDETVESNDLNHAVNTFPDGGQVFLRSDQQRSSVFTFRSGPPLGTSRYAAGIRGGYGHSDPANGSFLIYGKGEFLISGPGPSYRRETALHNTITINGAGQIGDTAVWLPDFFPVESLAPPARFRTDGKRVVIAAELTPNYLPHLGVTKCLRNMFVNTDLSILGVDTVECSRSQTLEWNLHSWNPFQRMDDGHRILFTCGSGENGLQLALLQAHAFEWETGPTEMVPAYPHDGTRDYYLRVSTVGRSARFVWWLGPSGSGIPERVSDGGSSDLAWICEPDLRVRFDGAWLIPDSFADES